jgi:hypothetical protein
LKLAAGVRSPETTERFPEVKWGGAWLALEETGRNP